jgi:hypothetical protein
VVCGIAIPVGEVAGVESLMAESGWGTGQWGCFVAAAAALQWYWTLYTSFLENELHGLT